MKTNPREGYLKSRGHWIHYLIWGATGPRLVLLHSMGMDAHGFDDLANALQENYQILAFDILDHGDSEKPSEPIGVLDHAEIMREGYLQLGFFPNVLIGHSIGGMMGIVLAAEHPDELNGLVLVDIAPFDPSKRPARPSPPEHFMDEDEARIYIKQRYTEFAPEAVENRMKYAFVKDEKGLLHLKGTGETIRKGMGIDLWPYVERIRVPTMLIIGSISDLITPEAQQRMREKIPGLEVATVDGATHMVPQDKPREFEGLVRAFLKKIG